MKPNKFIRKLALGATGLVAGIALGTSAYANTSGGATIHNAATLTYNGTQQVTDSVNVSVLTIGSDPAIALTSTGPFTVNAGDTITLNYTITATANGSDSYSLAAVNSTTSGMSAGSTFNVSTNTVTLGAAFTTQPSAPIDGDTGTLFIAAGSEANLSVGDTVVLSGNVYTVEAVRPGTAAFTIGNSTTAEVPTEVDLTVPLASGSPVIGLATVAAGVAFGERGTFSVDVTVSAPTTSGTNGTVDVVVDGNTSALNIGGSPEPFTTLPTASGGDDASITVLSATVTILKEARNFSDSGTFATSGVTAQAGDVIEYRITMEVTPGGGNAITSILVDEVPQYTTYVVGSTTLNTVAVADDGVLADPANSRFPLASANGGLGVNSANGTADQVNGGVLVDGDTGTDAAVVTFQVTVQ